jgi:hypothetical protein
MLGLACRAAAAGRPDLVTPVPAQHRVEHGHDRLRDDLAKLRALTKALALGPCAAREGIASDGTGGGGTGGTGTLVGLQQ